MSFFQGLARRWSERGMYASYAGWALGVYDHLLRRVTLSLPMRRRLRRLRLRTLQNPVLFRMGSSDLLVIEEIFHRGEYDCVVNSGFEVPRLILDLGANSGYSVRLWNHHYPEARIVAVEPDAESARVCRMNCEIGGCSQKVTVVEACAAGWARPVSLNRNGTEWSFTMSNTAEPGASTIQALTVPQILSEAGQDDPIGLLKCDIEGAEQELFKNAQSWLARTKMIVAELHGSYGLQQLQQDLQAGGSRFELLSANKSNSLVLLKQW